MSFIGSRYLNESRTAWQRPASRTGSRRPGAVTSCSSRGRPRRSRSRRWSKRPDYRGQRRRGAFRAAAAAATSATGTPAGRPVGRRAQRRTPPACRSARPGPFWIAARHQLLGQSVPLREFIRAHLSAREHHVELDDDRHRTLRRCARPRRPAPRPIRAGAPRPGAHRTRRRGADPRSVFSERGTTDRAKGRARAAYGSPAAARS